MTDTAPPLAAGVPYGRYLIRKRLARGGMGEVFLADQVGPMGPVRPVALKRMLPRIAGDPRASKMFLGEMSTAAQLNHPNIATTYDFGEIDGMYYLAMEYVEGVSVRQLLDALGPLPVNAALAIICDVAHALGYAHARKAPDGAVAPVVHRDVSPHNIMVSTDGAVKLLDFGIAKAEAVVMGGRLEGKIAYAAPEQLQGGTVDRRSDLWAVGVVLYEALSGVRPFEHHDPVVMVAAALKAGYERLSLRRPEAKPLDRLIERALKADREARWETAEQLAVAAQEVAQGFGIAGPELLAQLVRQAGGPAKSTVGVEHITSMGKPAIPAAPTATIQVADIADDDAETVPTMKVEDVAAAMNLGSTGFQAVVEEALPLRWDRTNALLAIAACLLIGLGAGYLVWTNTPTKVKTWPATTETAPAPQPRLIAIPAPAAATPEPPIEAPAALEPPPETSRAPPNEVAAKKKPARRRARPRKAAPAKAAARAPAAQTGLGMLSLRTVPWGPAEIDGRRVGPPLNKQPFKPGKHHLTLFPPEGLGKPPVELDVIVRSGQVTKVFVDFNRGITEVD